MTTQKSQEQLQAERTAESLRECTEFLQNCSKEEAEYMARAFLKDFDEYLQSKGTSLKELVS